MPIDRRPLRRRGSPMLLMGTGLREENIDAAGSNAEYLCIAVCTWFHNRGARA
jgi:hypothetical protein